MASTASGRAFSPAMMRAGSPGIRWIIKNVMMVTTNNTGSICRIRFRI